MSGNSSKAARREATYIEPRDAFLGYSLSHVSEPVRSSIGHTPYGRSEASKNLCDLVHSDDAVEKKLVVLPRYES
jgi:hypothetical protein